MKVIALNRNRALAAISCLTVTLSLHAAAPARLDDPVEGQKLAQELRAMTPSEDTTFTGVLRLSAPGREPREVPIKSSVTAKAMPWVSTYEARPAGAPVETLVIRHFAAQANEYEWRRGEQAAQLSPQGATNSFAGSDFALLDLGLDFFHWPTQTLVWREMRKGSGCDVLESRSAPGGPYAFVRSWIDQDSRAQGQPGLLLAEAYGQDGKRIKEFEIKGFTRVAGRWQLSEMEMRNLQTKTRTRLQFNFDEK